MIRYHQLGTTAYGQERFVSIEREERTRYLAYLDAAKEQNPTIGIGFNLRAYMDVVARRRLALTRTTQTARTIGDRLS